LTIRYINQIIKHQSNLCHPKGAIQSQQMRSKNAIESKTKKRYKPLVHFDYHPKPPTIKAEKCLSNMALRTFSTTNKWTAIVWPPMNAENKSHR